MSLDLGPRPRASKQPGFRPEPIDHFTKQSWTCFGFSYGISIAPSIRARLN